MKRTFVFLFVLVILLSCLLCACDQTEKQPFDTAYYQVSETYINFMETAMEDWSKAINDYCYFENDEDKTLSLTGTPCLHYEIIRIEKLSDSLWVIETFTKSEPFPNGVYGVNYVGIWEGTYYVFLNVKNIPAALTEGVEIEPYEIHGPDIL